MSHQLISLACVLLLLTPFAIRGAVFLGRARAEQRRLSDWELLELLIDVAAVFVVMDELSKPGYVWVPLLVRRWGGALATALTVAMVLLIGRMLRDVRRERQ